MLELLNNIVDLLGNTKSVEKLDFTKKEDVEKFDKVLEEFENNKFFSSLIDMDYLKDVQKKVHEYYDNSCKKNEEENDDMPESVKNSIINLATEYVNTKICPEVDWLSAKEYKDLVDGLTDFGMWIYKK